MQIMIQDISRLLSYILILSCTVHFVYEPVIYELFSIIFRSFNEIIHKMRRFAEIKFLKKVKILESRYYRL